jgi:hypothetical protein
MPSRRGVKLVKHRNNLVIICFYLQGNSTIMLLVTHCYYNNAISAIVSVGYKKHYRIALETGTRHCEVVSVAGDILLPHIFSVRLSTQYSRQHQSIHNSECTNIQSGSTA